jgi:hypothetical protein
MFIMRNTAKYGGSGSDGTREPRESGHQDSNMTYLTHALIAFNQAMNSLNGKEALVHIGILVTRVEDIRSDNRGEIVDIHLASGVLVHSAEGRSPIQEIEQDLHGIPVDFGEKAAGEVKYTPPLIFVLHF